MEKAKVALGVTVVLLGLAENTRRKEKQRNGKDASSQQQGRDPKTKKRVSSIKLPSVKLPSVKLSVPTMSLPSFNNKKNDGEPALKLLDLFNIAEHSFNNGLRGVLFLDKNSGKAVAMEFYRKDGDDKIEIDFIYAPNELDGVNFVSSDAPNQCKSVQLNRSLFMVLHTHICADSKPTASADPLSGARIYEGAFVKPAERKPSSFLLSRYSSKK